MKSRIIVHSLQKVVFPIALELYFNLDAGREVDEIKVKCWKLAAPDFPVISL